MSDPRRVSVIVVSRGRPRALRLCLTGIAQLHHPAFEIVVVADPAGIAAARDWAVRRPVKLVPFDEPNISAARNRGLAVAAGEIAAFIDDDAVPLPMWLHHLCAPFDDPSVAAAGGRVRGRNGISLQWGPRSVDHRGVAHDLPLNGTDPVILHPEPGRAIKTEGTNMALRRDVVAGMGGFDPAYRFYLDETDLNLRLARAGHATALVPLAEVHHGYLESPRRSARRVPRDLREIAASQAVVLRRHCPEAERNSAQADFVREQKRRLLVFMQTGPLGPDDVRRLMTGLRDGLAEGRARTLAPPDPIPAPAEGFLRFPSLPPADPLVLAGRAWSGRRLRARAAEAAAAGRRVSLYLFSPTGLWHRRQFMPEGYWLQKGGLFGRSERNDPLFRPWRFRDRVAREVERVSMQHGPGADSPGRENRRAGDGQ
ncbi:glycosyltransferase [Aquicoccus sp. SCR17]|nr:glycosyltransferase [Carideicomes alvinocaridis]